MTFSAFRRSGDTGSLAMAMLLILVGVSLAGLLVPVAIVQIGSTRSEVRRNHAVEAAQAGLEAVIAQIRAADDGSGNGVRASLPCGTLTGTVGGATERYQVSVFYLAFDPQSEMNAGTTWFAANDITCTAGSGPSTLPYYAVAFSTGTEVGSARTLRGAYRLRSSNQNIAGGRIHIIYTAASTVDLCMDSGTTITPSAGTPLVLQTCDGTRKQQVFAYTQDDTLVLVNSVTAARPTGMCLDAGSPQVEGALVEFQPCASPAVANQQWQLNGNAEFQGMDSSGNTNSFVFQLLNPNTSGTAVKITTTPTYSGVYNNIVSFSPESAVGPGDAGPQNNQLVNFNQFGRCLDLTGGSYQAGFMIAWPCKPSWNQAYIMPVLSTSATSAIPAKITMTTPAGEPSPAGLYCLQSPRSTAAFQYAVLIQCTSTDAAADLQWRAYGFTGSYGTSYRIRDVDGNCLQPTDPDAPSPDTFDVGAQMISKIVVQPCDESTLQKWNADPNILAGLSMRYVGEN